MKIQLLSDLHFEMWRDLQLESLVAEADVLVLAGDIGVGRSNVKDIVNSFAKYYANVIYVPGNHEYYMGLGINDFDIIKGKLASNVHYLNPGRVKIDDVTFIGATLWTNFRDDPLSGKLAAKYINDFRRMKNTTPEIMVAKYREHLEYIKMQYEATEGKKVIVTHFMPAKELIHPRWKEDSVTFLLNDYFANDLGDWIANMSDTVWLYGHTHDRSIQQIGDTKLYANPLGYPRENAEPYQPLIL